jgi:hypothetical protein
MQLATGSLKISSIGALGGRVICESFSQWKQGPAVLTNKEQQKILNIHI